ncbi:hypothetical protein GWI33_019410 [Rhynchophorus ferrugineus]|uniref:Uncharacterized protein n=1 Tax=Rhynchophorus ferrugineus TaxID=354439 RepID=A0A834HUP4_RHYFE|nr:hypothetical protein GWI33_019410 [Rhynchophorus ferrugineus]
MTIARDHRRKAIWRKIHDHTRSVIPIPTERTDYSIQCFLHSCMLRNRELWNNNSSRSMTNTFSLECSRRLEVFKRRSVREEVPPPSSGVFFCVSGAEKVTERLLVEH